MGQTRVDLQHLLEDLRDAYPGSLEETILTEVVANALDSRAGSVSLLIDPAEALLVVKDDGAGMSKRELSRYHDVAASTKARGEGIGFAGVGIKLGLLVSAEVLTETRRASSHVATRWHLASRHRAPWKWVDPPGFLQEQGTAVCLRLRNPLSPLLDAGFVEAVLARHFQPLLDSAFDAFLQAQYGQGGITFRVNGAPLRRHTPPPGAAAIVVKLPRKRRPAAVGYLERSLAPLEEDRRGIAIATMGKVIRRGWEWLAVIPAAHDRIAGVIEAPGLAEALTLNKADFLRSGPRGLLYLTYRKAIQEAVGAQLAAWGDRLDADQGERRVTRPVERDLEAVLVDLSDDFPALAALVERRPGGQRRLPSAGAASGGSAFTARETPSAEPSDAPERLSPGEAGDGPASEGAAASREPTDEPTVPPGESTIEIPGAARGPRKPARYGITLQFEDRAESPELSRLLESTVLINTAHPAYSRAVASRAEGYHLALGVAMALAPLAAEASAAHAFVTAFLARWGEALERDGRRRRPVVRRKRRAAHA